MTGFNGTALSYDPNGNLTGDGTKSYGWDARNHLTGIAGGLTASFLYDAFGRRVSKSINGSVTQLVYDRLNPVQELDGANPANVTANLLTGLNVDEYLTRADSNGAMNFLSDSLGSTLTLADSSGAINTSYTYDPFGNTTIGGSNPSSYQFTGRENDGTGLYFYRARYSSPALQRFVSQDPIDLILGGPNLYAYVLNNTISISDPTGLLPKQLCSYYFEMCQTDPNFYYCSLAPWVCGMAPDNPTDRCIADCLQEMDRQSRSCGEPLWFDVVPNHEYCFAICIGMPK